MTSREALHKLLHRYIIGARLVDWTSDPAGGDYTYRPDADDLDAIEALTGQRPEEDDLYFSVHSRSCEYHLRPEFLDFVFNDKKETMLD